MSLPEMPDTSYNLELFADYHHFYLQDEDAEGDLSDSWDTQAIANLLAVGPGIIGVGTVRNTDVPVSLTILDAQPEQIDFTRWDHITEASIAIPTGKLVVAGPSDYLPDAIHITVTPGTYRARIFYGGLDTLRDNGLDGDDHYQIVLWLEEFSPPTILKKWLPT